MNNKLNFVKQHQSDAFLTCIEELESAFVANGVKNKVVVNTKPTTTQKLFIKFISVFSKIPNNLAPFKASSKESNFAALLGPGFHFLFPLFYRSSHNYLYMFDAWPRYHKFISQCAKFLNVQVIFFSSKEATKLFNEHGEVEGAWIPEGIKIDDYFFNAILEKDIDVLEFGRKYDWYHDSIVNELAKNNKKHLYELKKGEVIFKTKHDFLKGLARTKISICVPSSITHPERAEHISTMTLRYLQSMASKCLIVGVVPDEMRLLFNYNPVIEIDKRNPGQQIIDILKEYESYIPLIEKNYEEVSRYHTWNVRVQQMLDIIENGTRKQ